MLLRLKAEPWPSPPCPIVIPTDSNGGFSFTAPLFCGVQIVKCVWSNATGS